MPAVNPEDPPSHTWEPIAVSEVFSVLDGAPFRWWISGGNALELHLKQRWRSHDDMDVGIVRDEAGLVYSWLSGWDLWAASSGELVPWHGEPLVVEREQNNVWARRVGERHWSIDFTVGSGDAAEWINRRNPAIRRGWDTAVLVDADHVPYLAPDIQLLFKSKNVRPKDDEDARQVIPSLTDDERRFLYDNLAPGHHWRQLLAHP